jgi:hypothetical protein
MKGAVAGIPQALRHQPDRYRLVSFNVGDCSFRPDTDTDTLNNQMKLGTNRNTVGIPSFFTLGLRTKRRTSRDVGADTRAG